MSPASPSGQPPRAFLDLQHEIEDYLELLVFSRETLTTPLTDAMRYSLLAGGKRLRPAIALATAEALGRPRASVLPLAAALEMIHTHSLIHDDLPAMSHRDARRGKPSAHVAFGDDVALLAGDALFAEAIALVLREQEGEPALVLAAVAELTRAVIAGLAGGQADLMLGAAVSSVLAVAGESGPVATALRQFAADVGVLSRILADMSARGEDGARERAQEVLALAHAALAQVPGGAAVALGCIADYILASQTGAG